jgi:RNA polymerase sigma-B factor
MPVPGRHGDSNPSEPKEDPAAKDAVTTDTAAKDAAARSPAASQALAGAARRDGAADLTSLFRRWQQDGDADARETLTRMFLPLARKLARRYSRAERNEDLDQVASLALLKAIDRFDPERGSGFPAFATPTILGELKRHFRDTGWFAHVPRGAQERALEVQAAGEELTSRNGRPPTTQQIAGYLGVELEAVLDGLNAAASYDAISLEAPLGSSPSDDNPTIGETLGDHDDGYELIEASATVAKLISALPDRERQILHLRFIEEKTQSEIAAEVGVSQMQVSRLLRRSIDGLRRQADGGQEAP